MKYTCIKKLSVNGKRYLIGDTIPDGEIHPDRVARLKRFGYIESAEGVAYPDDVDPKDIKTLADENGSLLYVVEKGGTE